MYRDPSDGSWRDVSGSIITTPGTPAPPDRNELYGGSTPTSTVVYDGSMKGEYQNQVVVADNGEGSPGLLFLTGGLSATSYDWTFARWNGASWESTTIATTGMVATTDHFMDSGALEFVTTQTVNAYLTREGTEAKGSSNQQYVDRGGDIEWWQSTDGGQTWSFVQKIATSQLDRGMIYNDPQVVVADSPEPEARVLFGEWDNDGGNMFHRAFLWGDGGYKQMEFLPDMKRIEGRDRYVVSAGISQEAFPLSAETVFVASGEVFSDALAGVPLAANYKDQKNSVLRGLPAPGPILLVQRDTIPSSVLAEIKRLEPKEIVVLGGPATISEGVYSKLDSLASWRVRRIGGANRYEVSANIAREIEAMNGPVDGVIYANGSDNKAGDALSVSPLAAAKRWPILLVGPEATRTPTAVKQYVNTLGTFSAVVAGGPASVADTIYTRGYPIERLAGPDRYSTSAAIAHFGLNGNAKHDPAMTMSRFSVTSGEVFSDALPGGVLQARAHGPVLLTQPGKMPTSIKQLLEREAYEVDRGYFLGGERSVEPIIVAEVAAILQARQDLQKP
jgi:putative cell wall-binding protein